MRKRISFLVIGGLIILAAMMLASCGGPKEEVVVDEAPPPVVDTTPVEPPPPPPPPPPPKLKAEQLQTIYFDFDKFNLRSDAKAVLDANYNLLVEFSDAIIKIEGHCDERGTVEYNLSLGEKRAKAVMDYLTGLGIGANRLSTISYGKERPLDSGHNEDAWGKNRRGEFKIISQ